MRATLIGEAFVVGGKPNPYEFSLPHNRQIDWEWTVTPKWVGTYKLSVSIEVLQTDAQGKPTEVVDNRSSGPREINVIAIPQTRGDWLKTILKEWGVLFDATTAALTALGLMLTAAGAVWVKLRYFGRAIPTGN